MSGGQQGAPEASASVAAVKAVSASAKPPQSLLTDIWMGGLASSLACLVSNPFEVCKTRLQIQGELASRQTELATRKYRGFVHCFATIARTEGIRGLQSGLVSAICFQTVMNGTRLGSYDFVNRTLRGNKDPSQESYYFLKNMAVAASVGSFGALLGNPFFLVKVRMQIASNAQALAAPSPAVAAGGVAAGGAGVGAPLGVQHHYRGVLHGLTSIVREEGVLGLYRNSQVPMLRVAMGSATQLTTYDFIKRGIQGLDFLPDGLRQGPPAHALSSLTAASLVALVMNPFDVVT